MSEDVMVIYDYDVPEYDIWHMMIDDSMQGQGIDSQQFQCDPCSPGRMGSSPLTNASEAGSLVLCFDIDCDPGLEVHGEVVG